eukprot:3539773-Lingulodinium_polyedra.AAC.1
MPPQAATGRHRPPPAVAAHRRPPQAAQAAAGHRRACKKTGIGRHKPPKAAPGGRSELRPGGLRPKGQRG